MESPSKVVRTAEAQQVPMDSVCTRAAEVATEVPGEPSYPSSNTLPHTAKPTVPLLSQLWVNANQEQNSFYNAVQGESDTPLWIYYFGLLLLTIASLFMDQVVYNHWTGILFAFLLVVAANYTQKYFTTAIEIRMAGENVRAGQLFPIYIAGGLGLIFTSTFSPSSLLSS